jgi:multidrug efflux pump subunit AcrA (membrane-fusion protein)
MSRFFRAARPALATPSHLLSRRAAIPRTPLGLVFRNTTRGFAVHEVPVPSLGDSVTDGTLVEFVKGLGEAVASDDIVAVIETDKVSIDIRSPIAGTVTGLLVGEDDTVIVGQGILTLDPEVEATVDAPAVVEPTAAVTPPPPAATSAAKAPAAAAPPALPAATPATVSTPQAASRRPRIAFRHGDREAIARTRQALFEENLVGLPGGISDFDAQFLELPELYRRLPITEEEMLAIELGGAID